MMWDKPMRTTSFGSMANLSLLGNLDSKCEVMHFDKPGRPHAHNKDEVAILISGQGLIHIDGHDHDIYPGQYLYIPRNTKHYMIPIEAPMCMLIAYLAEDTL